MEVIPSCQMLVTTYLNLSFFIVIPLPNASAVSMSMFTVRNNKFRHSQAPGLHIESNPVITTVVYATSLL